MPIYEYRCEDCGHTLDALQKVSDDPLRDCPSCGKAALKRLISAPAFRLKGSGWYETDFKSDKEKKRNLAESAAGESKSESKDKSSGGSDSKVSADAGKKSADKSSGSSGDKKPPKGSGKGSEAA